MAAAGPGGQGGQCGASPNRESQCGRCAQTGRDPAAGGRRSGRAEERGKWGPFLAPRLPSCTVVYHTDDRSEE